jgi:hypothetical protein
VPDLRHIYSITLFIKKEDKMKRQTARKIGFFIIIGFMIFFICGCETINAFRSGSVRLDDVKTMTKAENMSSPRTSGPKPLYLSSATSEEKPFSCGWERPTRQSEIIETIKGTDTWIKKNLW